MERTRTNQLTSGQKVKQATAILTADWHLRDDIPICRTDNFQEVLWKKVDFISALQKEHNCSVIHAGDLFNHWKPSPYLLGQAIKHIPDCFYTIYGNHDLPQHNLELVDRCGINVLKEAGKVFPFRGTHWNQTPTEASMLFAIEVEPGVREVLVWHVMTYQGKLPWPDCPDPLTAGLIRKYHKFDLILTGHNHKTFIEEYDGRLLINPGSISRQEAGQMNHRPCVFLWYADTNTVQKVFIPIEDNVISREHIDIQEQRENRIDSFISRLNTDWEASLSFEENLQIFEKTNNVRKSVMEIIYKSLE